MMQYENFLLELEEHLQETDFGKRLKVRLYMKGFLPETESEKNIVQSANQRVSAVPSDTLLTDVVSVLLAQDEETPAPDEFRINGFQILANSLYRCYKHNGWYSVDTRIVTAIHQVVSQHDNETVANMYNYEKIHDRVIIRLLPVGNTRKFSNCIYKRVGDMALVVYLMISDVGNSLLTTKVQQSILTSWRMSPEEAFDRAMSNTMDIAPPRLLLSMSDAANPAKYGVPFMNEADSILMLPLDSVHLTTPQCLNGAVAIFYPGVAARISELLGRNYYILFLNSDLIRIIAEDHVKVRELRQTLNEINNAFPRTTLTNSVYMYDRKFQKIRRVSP